MRLRLVRFILHLVDVGHFRLQGLAWVIVPGLFLDMLGCLVYQVTVDLETELVVKHLTVFFVGVFGNSRPHLLLYPGIRQLFALIVPHKEPSCVLIDLILDVDLQSLNHVA